MLEFKTKSAIVIQLFRSIGVGLIFILISGYLVYNVIGETFTNYLLANYGETTKGQIYEVIQDATDNEGGETMFNFHYSYTFSVTGKAINGGGSADGQIPDEYADAANEPVQVEVVYMKANPQVNMLKKAINVGTFYIFKRLILSIIIAAFTIYILLLAGKTAMNRYVNDLAYNKLFIHKHPYNKDYT